MILLSKSYLGYTPGSIVQLTTNQEAAMIAQGVATASAGPVTAGPVTITAIQGRLGIAAAGTSVVVTNPSFTTESKFTAYLSNAAADATALYITRITPANGSVTFTLNAAATAAVSIDWQLLIQQGEFAVV
jgi:hypothetical protein